MTLYHITNGFFHDYMLPDWEDYLDDINEEDTIIDITIEEYGKMFPQPPMTIYDLGGSSYLANWIDPPIDIELYNRNETAAQNITEIKITEEDYIKLFGEEPIVEITEEMRKEQEEMTKLINSLFSSKL